MFAAPKAGLDADTQLYGDARPELPAGATFVPFSAYTRMSGLDFADGRKIRKGAPDAVRAWVREQGASAIAPQLDAQIERIARAGGTPLLLADERGLLARDRAQRHPQTEHAACASIACARWAFARS